MRRLMLIAALVMGACGEQPMGPGGGVVIDDTFTSTACATKADCDDLDPCTVDTCTPMLMCEWKPVSCSNVSDDCNVGACEEGTGKCVKMPANDAKPCKTAMDLKPGLCAQGMCIPIPQCKIDNPTYANTCRFGSETGNTSSTIYAKKVLDTYSCAGGQMITNETGPEVAYLFTAPANDTPITVKLSGTSVDLDLIILEGGDCIANAACAAAGTTVGTGEETVTFNAKASQNYLFVIEGKNNAQGAYKLDVLCPKTCPNDATTKTLACNQTIAGDLTAVTLSIPSTLCSMDDKGPADVYVLDPPAGKNYTIALTGPSNGTLTQDLDLQVLESYSSTAGKIDCDYQCESTGVAKMGTDSETFTGYLSSFATYIVLVAAKSTGGPYGLAVTCQ
jgi:hypothetical protein